MISHRKISQKIIKTCTLIYYQVYFTCFFNLSLTLIIRDFLLNNNSTFKSLQIIDVRHIISMQQSFELCLRKNERLGSSRRCILFSHSLFLYFLLISWLYVYTFFIYTHDAFQVGKRSINPRRPPTGPIQALKKLD